MKKIVSMCVITLLVSMAACSDKPVTPEQLPEPVKSFVKEHFPDQSISFADKDLELTGCQYDVVLADGSRIDFDTDNMWEKIEGTLTAPVPTDLIPPAIVTHIQSNFPDAMIIKIDKESYGYEVELANGLELKFNKEGALMEVDD